MDLHRRFHVGSAAVWSDRRFRAGARAAVRLLLTAQAIAVAGLARSNQAVALGILSVIIGSFPPGIVPMVLAWIRELYPAAHQNRQNAVWSGATIDFAAFQALAAYAFSAIYAASGGDYRLIFMLVPEHCCSRCCWISSAILHPPDRRLRRHCASPLIATMSYHQLLVAIECVFSDQQAPSDSQKPINSLALKGKPAARRGRKASGLEPWREIAGLPEPRLQARRACAEAPSSRSLCPDASPGPPCGSTM